MVGTLWTSQMTIPSVRPVYDKLENFNLTHLLAKRLCITSSIANLASNRLAWFQIDMICMLSKISSLQLHVVNLISLRFSLVLQCYNLN